MTKIAILLAAALSVAPALAQIPPPREGGPTVGTTATGGLPDRATTATGQTKPPGAAEGDRLGTRPDLEAKSRELDRKIDTGICAGCN